MTPFLFSSHKKLLEQFNVSKVSLFPIVSAVVLAVLNSIVLAQVAVAQVGQVHTSKKLSELDHESEFDNNLKNLETSFERSREDIVKTACAVDSPLESVWRLTNVARSKKQKCGSSRRRTAPELKYDCELAAMAKLHATELSSRNVLSHTSANGDDMTARANKLNIAWLSLGENIASGHKTAEAAHTAWLASPGHCKNIMNPDFNSIGVALENSTWVVVFAKKSN